MCHDQPQETNAGVINAGSIGLPRRQIGTGYGDRTKAWLGEAKATLSPEIGNPTNWHPATGTYNGFQVGARVYFK